jgi:hypothetical protein
MLEKWDQSFPNCEPIGHTLKHSLPDRWVRFHSLPLSKRYAEDESEYRILLERHNAVLNRLFGIGSDAVLVTTKFFDWPSHQGPSATLWRKVAWERTDWEIYFEKVVWQPGEFDPIIRLVADDIASNVMFVDPSCRWIFAPYDGGMDLILETSQQRDQLKAEFKEWLSMHPGGL